MRRNDRAVTDRNDIINIIRKCDVCRLALNDEGYPYILPLNFGLIVKGDSLELVFHGAQEGTKYELIARDSRASFEMDCSHTLFSDESKGYCTMMYESVTGKGHIEMLDGKAKEEALDVLCSQYHKDGFKFNPAAIPRTKVFKLLVESVTGKVKS